MAIRLKFLRSAVEFFTSRFSLQERVLWRVLALLRPHKHIVVLGNVFLTLASMLAGIGLISLLPLATLIVSPSKESMPVHMERASETQAVHKKHPVALPFLPDFVVPDTPEALWSHKLAKQNGVTKVLIRDLPFLGNVADNLQIAWVSTGAWVTASIRRFVTVYALFLLFLLVLRGVFEFLGEYLMEGTAINVVCDVMRRTYRNVLLQELHFFNTTTTGYLINTCYKEVFQLQGLISLLASTRIILPITMLVLFCTLLTISVSLSMLMLVLLPIVILPMMVLSRKLRKGIEGQLREEFGMLDIMSEGLLGIQAVKGFGAEEQEMRAVDPTIVEYVNYARRRRGAQAMLGPVVDVLNMITVLSVFVAAALVMPENMRVQSDRLLVFMLVMTQFYKPFRDLMSMNIKMQRAVQVSKRIFALLDRKTQIADAPDAVEFPANWTGLVFDNVWLNYLIARRGRNKTRRALAGASFEIRRGEAVAIVGPNGAGKSSLVNLICRLYDPSSGQVRLDDLPLSRIKLRSLRENICLITQHPVLFNRTVADNIAYGLENAPREEIVEAAKATRAHDFIMQLAKGYDSPLGEQGRHLSGGERQKIALARAFVRHPKILILDEPTTGLDRETYAEFLDIIARLRGTGITLIYITHEWSQLGLFDRVFGMSENKQVEEMTAEALAGAKGG
ncbi:MAG: ABC transporter ATP-binding protein [Candidatus Sumerlaeota bacterium]|nr:ABC transporter ATP-binding protein [Candidatus Sumerlaeota bacterium]